MLYCNGLVIHNCIYFYYFLQTPLAKMCNAVRENSFRAEYIGYSSYMVRYLSFCFSGFIAGIAGTLFVINYELFSPEVFSLRESFNILCATFIKNFFLGPIIGASIFSLCSILTVKHRNLVIISRNYTNDFCSLLSQRFGWLFY